MIILNDRKQIRYKCTLPVKTRLFKDNQGYSYQLLFYLYSHIYITMISFN